MVLVSHVINHSERGGVFVRKRVSVLFLALSVMAALLFAPIESHAKNHEHAFSYVGNSYVKTQQVAEHQALVYNRETEKMETVTCYIYVDIFEEVEKCGCGMTRSKYFTRTWHSACGQ